MDKGLKVFSPYLFGDKKYLLLLWMMSPYKKGQQRTFLELLYNKKHKHNHSIVEKPLAF
jgi:hypothetical protein